MMSKKDKKKEQDTTEEAIEEGNFEEKLEALEEMDEPSELDLLNMQLEEVKAESQKNLDGWQRAQAEFVNYRKRVERDQTRTYEDAAARIIKSFLPVLDDLTRALQDRPTEGEAGEWASGMELIHRKLLNILEVEGVTRMEVEGEMFDPNVHEAISMEESPDHESGQIIEVIQPGYMIGERVLRAALVRVAS
jgi:molecular chaperone GrpE